MFSRLWAGTEKDLLKQITGSDSFEGAYNIRKDGQGVERKVTENVNIVAKEDKAGIDIYVKEDHELNSRKEIINIDKRISTVAGYSEPYSFYSPEYPDGPILGDVDYRRTLYWNPNVITNENGQATVELYNNSITGSFSISAAGITAGGQPYSFDQDF